MNREKIEALLMVKEMLEKEKEEAYERHIRLIANIDKEIRILEAEEDVAADAMYQAELERQSEQKEVA